MDTIALARFIKRNVETKFFTIWFEKKRWHNSSATRKDYERESKVKNNR